MQLAINNINLIGVFSEYNFANMNLINLYNAHLTFEKHFSNV